MKIITMMFCFLLFTLFWLPNSSAAPPAQSPGYKSGGFHQTRGNIHRRGLINRGYRTPYYRSNRRRGGTHGQVNSYRSWRRLEYNSQLLTPHIPGYVASFPTVIWLERWTPGYYDRCYE